MKPLEDDNLEVDGFKMFDNPPTLSIVVVLSIVDVLSLFFPGICEESVVELVSIEFIAVDTVGLKVVETIWAIEIGVEVNEFKVIGFDVGGLDSVTEDLEAEIVEGFEEIKELVGPKVWDEVNENAEIEEIKGETVDVDIELVCVIKELVCVFATVVEAELIEFAEILESVVDETFMELSNVVVDFVVDLEAVLDLLLLVV